MHKIFELREMDVEQLHVIASELNIKGFKKMDKDTLVYAILDEEARHNAHNAPEKPAKPKRGRPKKGERTEKADKVEKAEKAEKAERRAAADATKSSVKKINASIEKTTLGDITALADLKAQMEAAAKPKAKKDAE